MSILLHNTKRGIMLNNKILLLLVDDNEIDRMVFIKLLEITDSEIREAENGQEALNFLRKECFDCVILDYRLPDFDGLTLIKEIRKEFTIPIIVTTGFGDELLAVEMMKNGAQDYIPKQMAPELLVRSIENVIKLKSTELESQYYQNFYNNSPIGFFSESVETGEFVKTNPTFLNMINVKNIEELNNIKAYDIVDAKIRQKTIETIKEKGSIKDIELNIKTIDGQSKWCLATLTFCANKCKIEGGKCLKHCPGTKCVEGSIIDITEKKQLELELQELQMKELESLKEIQFAINERLKDYA
jgi:CheY-like chemotaxis protein